MSRYRRVDWDSPLDDRYSERQITFEEPSRRSFPVRIRRRDSSESSSTYSTTSSIHSGFREPEADESDNVETKRTSETADGVSSAQARPPQVRERQTVINEKWYTAEAAQTLPFAASFTGDGNLHSAEHLARKDGGNSHARYRTGSAGQGLGHEAEEHEVAAIKRLAKPASEASAKLEDEVTRFTIEKDLEFENAVRRLFWSSGIPREVCDEVLDSHRKKQQVKRRIGGQGSLLPNVKSSLRDETVSATSMSDKNTDSDASEASTVKQASHRGRARQRAHEERVPTRKMARVDLDDTYRHKVDVPPEAHSIFIAGPSGHVEFRAANGTLQHIEQWQPHEDENPIHLTDAPSSAPSSQAIERKKYDRKTNSEVKGELIVEMLESIRRKLDAAPLLQLTGDKREATVESLLVPNEVDSGVEQEDKKPLEYKNSTNAKKRKPKHWKGKMRATAPQKEVVTTA
ncbi:hypothetical protein LTR05_005335 [Lithohypha guttulata]|uniref:Uncharacterized protein n=1 Tax=Lithohypha guttulata TaxID=1690604 RepID=A0AAN7SXJ9_9EURO|nr:hypothetical protein LTR05_005335 [Lithohypha guttulata]